MSGSSSAVAGADVGAAALVAAASAGDCSEDDAAAGLSSVSAWCGAEPSSTTEAGPPAVVDRQSATSGEVGPRDRGRDRDVMAGDAATDADAEEPRECGREDACSCARFACWKCGYDWLSSPLAPTPESRASGCIGMPEWRSGRSSRSAVEKV